MRLFSLLFSLCFITLAHPVWACTDLFDGPLHLYAFEDNDVRSSESAEAVQRLIKRLHEARQNSEPGISTVYQSIDPDLAQAIAAGHEVIESGYKQTLVSRFIQQFGQLITAPVQYLSDFSYLATGGCSNRCSDYSFERHQKMTAEFMSNRKEGAEARYMEKWLEQSRKQWAKNLEPDRIRQNIMLEGYYENNEWDRDLFFQYKYIFDVGEQGLLEFVRIRETGKVIVGIPEGLRGDHDDFHGDILSFIRHDYLHAHLQKMKDARLFDSYGITNMEKAIELKKLNNQRLQELLAQWKQITEPKLKAAVKVVLFAALHEQAHSYPRQMKEAFDKKAVREQYRTTLASMVESGRMGKQNQRILDGAETEYLDKALQWIRPILAKDLAWVNGQFSN